MNAYIQAGFFNRCAAQQYMSANAENDPAYLNNVRELTGLYDNVRLFGQLDSRIEDAEYGGLWRFESWLAARIGAQLAQKGEDGDPVVALDLGGGIGGTWLKLGEYFKDAVDRGRLVLTVSNLARQPLDHLLWLRDQQWLRENEAQLWRCNYAGQLYRNFRDRVQYIDLNMAANGQEYRQPDGTWADLQGKADIVHERLSVTRTSRIPELHIARAAGFVSDSGVYMVRRQDTELLTGTMKPREAHARLAGISAVHAALPEMYELTRVDAVEEGGHAGEIMNYIMFRGSNALPVSAG